MKDMTIFGSTVQILLLLLIVFTNMQHIRKDVWWIRMADFPHVQITVLTCILFSINLILPMSWFQPGLMLAGIATLGYQLFIIAPYTRIWSKQLKTLQVGETCNTISILECNVLQHNENYAALNTLISKYDPDLLILLETDKKWLNGIKEAVKDYKYSIELPMDNTYGMLIYSKYHLISHDIRYLIDEEVPSVSMNIDIEGDYVRCYVVHPSPPSPTENYKSTERDAEMILVGKEVESLGIPVIVAGDLNDVAWSHTTRLFQRISKLRDPRIGRGFYNTFHAKYPLLRWPLDHVFFSAHWKIQKIKTLAKMGSDHLPVYIKAGVFHHKSADKVIDNLDASDKKEMKDKLMTV